LPKHDGRAVIDYPNAADFGNAVALQGDGKVLLAGSSRGAVTVVRLNADGTLDQGFGNGGAARTVFPNGLSQTALGVAVQPDGKIVAVGGAVIIDGIQDAGVRFRNATVLARYNSDGSPDDSFGSGGIVVLKTGEHSNAEAVVLQPDGKIVTAGETNGRTSIRRFLPSGAPDPGFAAGGEYLGPTGGMIALDREGDGKLVAGGDDDQNSIVVRVDANGAPDGSFGNGGVRVIPPLLAGHHAISALGIQSDEKVVWSGFGCGRLDADGPDDRSWNDRGHCEGAALVIQPDGKVITGGVIGDIPVSENAWIMRRFLTGGGGNAGALAAAARKQRVLKQKGVKLTINCPETPCIINTTGKVSLGSGKPRRLSHGFYSPRGAHATIKVIISQKVLAAIRAALARGKKVTITLRVFAEFQDSPPTKPQTVTVRAAR
jgi:uncharacterized delta-60 repeat protein